MFKVDRKALFTVNSFGQMMIATRHSNTVVNSGDKLAGMRIIPLVIEKEKMDKVRSFITSSILEIKPFVLKKQLSSQQEVKCIREEFKIHLHR